MEVVRNGLVPIKSMFVKGAEISNVVAFHKNRCAIVIASDEYGNVNPKLGDLCDHFKGLEILRNVFETLQGINTKYE
jgi:hypothetical protein